MRISLSLDPSTAEALAGCVVDLAGMLMGEGGLRVEDCSEDQLEALVEMVALTMLELGIQQLDWVDFRGPRPRDVSSHSLNSPTRR